MKKRSRMHENVLMCLLIVAGNSVSAAPQVDYPPPKPPFVAEVPEFARWTITEEKKNEPAAIPGAVPAPIRVQTMAACVKSGDIKHEIIGYGDGSKEEFWYRGGAYFARDSFNPQQVLILTGGMADQVAEEGDFGEAVFLQAAGFAGIDWIKPEDYKEVLIFKGNPCYHFVRADKRWEAWIEVKSRMPAAFRKGGRLFTYTFQDPPNASLEMPAEFARAWEKHRQRIERWKRLEQAAEKRK